VSSLLVGRRTATALLLLCLSVSLSACVPDGLAFRTDERLTILEPEDRSTVSLPVTIDWDIRDFEIVEPGGEPAQDEGYFAVFVDRSPMPPGEDLRWVARDDNSCRAADGCPDEEYLAARGIYTTTETEITLEQLPRTTDREDRKERHRVVVVLLNAQGDRIGESAFEVAFDVDRRAQS
jgi:hypothetical protein